MPDTLLVVESSSFKIEMFVLPLDVYGWFINIAFPCWWSELNVVGGDLISVSSQSLSSAMKDSVSGMFFCGLAIFKRGSYVFVDRPPSTVMWSSSSELASGTYLNSF